MTNRAPQFIVALVCSVLFAGCQPHRPAYRFDQGDLNYYVDQQTEIAYPDLETQMLDEVTQSMPPITVTEAHFDSFWDLSLEDTIDIALQNTKVIRGFGTPGLQGTQVAPGVDSISNGPGGAGTVFEIAIRESEPGFIGTPGQISPAGSLSTNTGLDSNQGVEAALAEFDAQFTSNLAWQRSDQPRNVIGTGLQFTPSFFEQDSVTFVNQIAKKSANGTQFFARNVNSYTANTIPATVQPLASVYQTALEFEIRQPLLRGRGAFINRMPVVVSRINSDQVIANFDSTMQNYVTNIEIRYWDLQTAYRNLQTAKDGRDAALNTYRTISENYKAGKLPLQDEAQARGQLLRFRGQVNQAWTALLNAETNLRWLLGVAMTDGRIIRPITEPTKAHVAFDYCQVMDEALTYRPSLRQERWEVKKKQLALAYSKNSLLPNLNINALYRWQGLGDDLINYNDNVPRFPQDRSGAFNELFGGDYAEFEMNVEFGMPIGFRRELANVRNSQLKLARELARLEDQELDVEREITQTLQALEAQYQAAVDGYNSWLAYQAEYEARETRVLQGQDPITFLLDAQRSRAEGENSYYQALGEYNKLLALLHHRKGTILAFNNIFLSEGAWPEKAYQDASENARRRGASRQINYGFTRPQVISRGNMVPESHGGTVTYDNTISAPIQEGVIYEDGSAPIQYPTEYYPQQGGELMSPTPAIEEVPANPVPNNGGVLPSPANGQPTPATGTPTDTTMRSRGTQGTRAQQTARVIHPTMPATSNVRQASNNGTQNVDWNRFGMAQPGENQQPSTTKAVIRQVNYEEPVSDR